ncbi:hypothetical protein FOA43_002695 [Brettanomyces nanus]|uniref:Uncharacterized protein n=1 Tax=Eeniella nana TaxID=13502 RepID=A0A875S5N5_EENNA|nr:uncharacterized protein FOA43_002695 [Brettanomyces nanus]QPG75342.1 hypothetical protein FOA43_002695 [Brettanomyces nanus]
MSFIPRLRRPLSNDTSSKLKDKVRFTGTLSDEEKRRRKADAYDYLRSRSMNESDSEDTITNRLRSSNSPRHQLRSILKPSSTRRTYELMGESPIRHISHPDRLGSERVLESVRREASKRSPLTRRIDSNYRIKKVEHHGLLNSLSNVGSKLLSSVLFNEKGEDEKLHNTSTRLTRWNREELGKMKENEDLERSIREKKIALDRLNRDLESRSLERLGPNSLEQKVEGIEKKKQDLRQDDGDERVMGELASIREDLLNMRKREESSRLKFESKMEELEMEAEINEKHYKRMVKELEEKRREVDKQKDELIKELRKMKKRRREKYEGESEESDSDDDRETKRRRVRVGTDLREKLERMTRKMKSMEREVSRNEQMAKRTEEMVKTNES